MTLHETLKHSISDALRSHDEVRLRTLRSLVAAMTNEAIAKKLGPEAFLTDADALAVLKRAANQRKDSIEQYEKAARQDLAEPEKAELYIIEGYLPTLMTRDEILAIARPKLAEMGLLTGSDAGRFTGVLMKELQGKADGALVKEVVDSLLS